MAEEFLKTLDIAALTDIGLKRQRNEDSNRLVVPPAGSPQEKWGALFMVADGMGGLGGGDVASQAAITEVFHNYYDINNAEEDIQARLLGALEIANGVVRDQAPKLNLPRIGSTAAGIVLLPSGKLLAFNIGDCRVYRIRNRKIERISHDQSIMETRIELGMSPEEAARSSNSSMVTAFLGQPLPVKPFFIQEQAQENDVYLMCSDGLWSLVEAPEILKIIQNNPAEAAAQKLINLALKRGGSDNVTAVIARIGKPPRASMGIWPLAAAALVLIAVLALGWVFFIRKPGLTVLPVTPTQTTVAAASGSTATSAAVQVLPTSTATTTPTSEPPTASATSPSEVPALPTEVSTQAATESLTADTATPAPTATEPPSPTETSAPSITPTETLPPTYTSTPTPSDTLEPTVTLGGSARTFFPRTPTELPLSGKPYIVLEDVEAKRCPEADCNFTVKLTKGSVWFVTEEVQGGLIPGSKSNLWYKLAYKNEAAYVHSSYLAPAEPF